MLSVRTNSANPHKGFLSAVLNKHAAAGWSPELSSFWEATIAASVCPTLFEIRCEKAADGIKGGRDAGQRDGRPRHAAQANARGTIEV